MKVGFHGRGAFYLIIIRIYRNLIIVLFIVRTKLAHGLLSGKYSVPAFEVGPHNSVNINQKFV